MDMDMDMDTDNGPWRRCLQKTTGAGTADRRSYSLVPVRISALALCTSLRLPPKPRCPPRQRYG